MPRQYCVCVPSAGAESGSEYASREQYGGKDRSRGSREPEPFNNLRFGHFLKHKVIMQRTAQQNSAPGSSKPEHLQHHAKCLGDEYDTGQQQQ